MSSKAESHLLGVTYSLRVTNGTNGDKKIVSSGEMLLITFFFYLSRKNHERFTPLVMKRPTKKKPFKKVKKIIGVICIDAISTPNKRRISAEFLESGAYAMRAKGLLSC